MRADDALRGLPVPPPTGDWVQDTAQLLTGQVLAAVLPDDSAAVVCRRRHNAWHVRVTAPAATTAELALEVARAHPHRSATCCAVRAGAPADTDSRRAGLTELHAVIACPTVLSAALRRLRDASGAGTAVVDRLTATVDPLPLPLHRSPVGRPAAGRWIPGPRHAD